jgi:hypothetical protein
MLIENIELSHALRLTEESTSGPSSQNFYDIFGTDGCSLDCNNMRALQEFRHRPSPLSSGEKKTKASMTRKDGRSFTAQELQASVLNGCRSCELFSLIFSQIFPEYKGTAHDSTMCTYTISNESTLYQHLEKNRVTSVQMVQLFHPCSKLIFESC